jgi:hypothetical protein
MTPQRLACLFTTAALCVAGTAVALTVDDVLGLHRAGASDAVIISQIDSEGTVFRLTVEEILQLKNTGVSDAVITYMINTGKTAVEAEPAPVPLEAPLEENDDGTEVQGSVYLSLGGYYPNWPGYGWSYYYDPFWWPSFSFYFGYWSPYPYYAYYYDPFYHCHPYAHDYWYPYYGYGNGYYGDYYDRHEKGRHVGSRGGVHGDRNIKHPDSRVRAGGRTVRSPVGSPEVARAGRTVKQPGRQTASRVGAHDSYVRRPVQRAEVRRADPVERGSVRRVGPGKTTRNIRAPRPPRAPSDPVQVQAPEVKTNPTPSRVGKPTRSTGISRPDRSTDRGRSWGGSPFSTHSSRPAPASPRSSGGGRRGK